MSLLARILTPQHLYWLSGSILVGLALLVYAVIICHQVNHITEDGPYHAAIATRGTTQTPVVHEGATESWSPADEVANAGITTELLLIQTSADRRVEAEELAHPIDPDSAAIIDNALAGIREACDRGRDAILAGEAMAEARAYYRLAELHRNPDHTPDETASMHIRAELDAMLATDGRDNLAGAR